jgi:hypothetical protein
MVSESYESQLLNLEPSGLSPLTEYPLELRANQYWNERDSLVRIRLIMDAHTEIDEAAIQNLGNTNIMNGLIHAIALCLQKEKSSRLLGLLTSLGSISESQMRYILSSQRIGLIQRKPW